MYKKKIKKIIVGVLLSLAINLAYEVVDISYAYAAADYVIVNATNVNVRSDASIKSKSLGKVSTGECLLRYEERTDGWSYISYKDKNAYIKTEFLTPYTQIISDTTVANSAPATVAMQSSSSNRSVNASSIASSSSSNQTTAVGSMVYISGTGKKYHKKANCSNMKSPSQVTLSEAQGMGLTPCKRCY